MDKRLYNIAIPDEYQEIAPYNDIVFKEKVRHLIDQPGFEEAVKYMLPVLDYETFKNQLLAVECQSDFQSNIMAGILQYLEKATTHGISIDGESNITADDSYTFITNHRDIVLDASFLNLVLQRSGMPLTQVAIGNNLLIYDWITDLVKLNRSFIVKRDVKMVKALEAAKQLSGYIHFAINNLHESVWIAQREGRAKDSNDLTQESLIKMISLGGGGSTKDNILSANLCPVSISYEYDPNDYLKAAEFLKRRRDPNFKKSKRDDLFSMQTGIMSQKGRIMFRIGRCINPELMALQSDNRLEIIRYACRLIDREIHLGYEIYPGNYISYDEINHTDRFKAMYTAEDVKKFDEYIAKQLARIKLPEITCEEYDYMREMMLAMYANPLKNKLQAAGK